MIRHEVKNRISGKVQFTAEIDCDEDALPSVRLGLSVKWAFKIGANLRGADLGGANLRDADLRDANLRGANLGGANLGGADLRDANLRGANLGGADLGGADLRDADLGDADLGGANLRDANLRGANLGGADLGGANLGDADLGDADLGGANLGGANLIDGGQRSDGYRFIGHIKDGALMICAGCRYFTLPEARAYWGAAGYRNRALGDEALVILDHIEKVAAIRKLLPIAEAA